MRTMWMDIGGYDTLHEARAARSRAIARREALCKPKPVIVKLPNGSFLLAGRVILKGSWAQGIYSGGGISWRLYGNPVKPPRPIKKRVRKLRPR